MNDLIKEMYEPCLQKIGFKLDKNCTDYCSEGICYKSDENKGRGYYWVYVYKNLFSISIINYTPYEDFYFEYKQPRYLSLNYYDSISGEELQPYKRLTCNCIRGHIADNNLYRSLYHANIPIISTSIDIMPEYYEDYLNKKYPGDFKNPESAFESIDGSIDFPELVLILRQINKFRGTGISAQMYYEGKVTEAISLIIEKTKNKQNHTKTKHISNDDLNSLTSVTDYIDDHFCSDIHLDKLARIACMGTTKLKYTFKEKYKCTITQYIQNKRMSQAEYLLSNTDLDINQIARAVGYSHGGYFSKLFEKNTGLLPRKYRELSFLK